MLNTEKMTNKITYESDMIMSECVNVSCNKIDVLREAVGKETNEIVKEALYDVIVEHRKAINKLLKWVTIN